MRTLQPLDKLALDSLTKQIHGFLDEGYRQYFKAGELLKKINDRGLWEEKFDSFKQFFETTFGQSVRRAYQLIETYQIAKELPSEARNAFHADRHVRAIKDVPKKDVPKVVEEAAKDGKVTTESLQKAAAAATKPPVQLDKEGTKIPTPALPFWERRDEVQPWLNQISAIKCAIENALKEGDALFAWIGNPAIDFLSSAYAAISNAKLYAVCTECEGWFDKGSGCQTCHNTGLISKHQFDVCSRREVKTLREKSKTLHL